MNKRYILILLLLLAGPQYTALAAEVDPEATVTKTLVWPDGTRYVGGVVAGKRSGKGTIFWQDGTRFVGQFENDMRNGPGTMILPDGTVYTGFFRNDELIDTQATIAASNAAESMGMDEDSTADALGNTELPMEADGIGPDSAPADMTGDEGVLTEQTQEEPGVTVADASDVMVEDPMAEAMAEKAPAESDEPDMSEESDVAEVAEVEVKAPTPEESESNALPSTDSGYSLDDPYASEVTDVTAVTASVEEALKDAVNQWALAWQEQNVTRYLASYSSEFVVPGKQSRRTWEALRRTRINRPSYINLNVDFQRFELVDTNVVDVFFRQAYRSNTYSDLTDKVLRMHREGEDWKIMIERSR